MVRYPVCPECGWLPVETCPHGSVVCPVDGLTIRPGDCTCVVEGCNVPEHG